MNPFASVKDASSVGDMVVYLEDKLQILCEGDGQNISKGNPRGSIRPGAGRVLSGGYVCGSSEGRFPG
jgi:hypothetical protein